LRNPARCASQASVRAIRKKINIFIGRRGPQGHQTFWGPLASSRSRQDGSRRARAIARRSTNGATTAEVERARYLLDLTNRRGPTGFADFCMPDLSEPANHAAMTRFVMHRMSDHRGRVLGQTDRTTRLNGYRTPSDLQGAQRITPEGRQPLRTARHRSLADKPVQRMILNRGLASVNVLRRIGSGGQRWRALLGPGKD
jgi:hypothetical protein